MRTLTALGGMLPAIGVAILLRQVIKRDIEIIYYLFGFVLIAALNINMISLAIIGAFFAYLHFLYLAPKEGRVAQAVTSSDEEEEL